MRRVVLLVAVVAMAALSGCPLDGGQIYEGDASQYLLTGDEIGNEWTVEEVRGPNIDPLGLESAQTIELSNGNDNLSVAIGVFESVDDAQTFLEDRRTSLRSSGVPLSDADVGDDASVLTTGERSFLVTSESNVYVEVYGNIVLADARRIAVEQLEKVRGS